MMELFKTPHLIIKVKQRLSWLYLDGGHRTKWSVFISFSAAFTLQIVLILILKFIMFIFGIYSFHLKLYETINLSSDEYHKQAS